MNCMNVLCSAGSIELLIAGPRYSYISSDLSNTTAHQSIYRLGQTLCSPALSTQWKWCYFSRHTECRVGPLCFKFIQGATAETSNL